MANASFELFVGGIVHRHDHQLFNEGPDEQTANGVAALTHFAKTTPLRPVVGRYVDLAGFGQADIVYESDHDEYLLLSDVAAALGMPVWKACEWARQDHLWAIEDQRSVDEERGDGRLGYKCLRSLVDLRLDFIEHDVPDAKPDANGERWAQFGEWLIARDRLPAFILVSPWGREFMDNTMPHMAHVGRKVWGSAFGALFDTDGMTEEEALRRATRGPNVPPAAGFVPLISPASARSPKGGTQVLEGPQFAPVRVTVAPKIAKVTTTPSNASTA